MPVALKYQSDLPSLCIKTAPLQKVLWGSQWVDKYFARVLNPVQFIPIFNPEIPLCTARTPQNGYGLIVFTVFSALTKTYSGKEGISSTSCQLGRWAPRTALQTILTCALQHAPGNSSPTEGSKWKKKQNQKMHKPCQSPSWSTWASLTCSEPGCLEQEHKNITQTRAFIVPYWNQTMLAKNPNF